MISYRANQMINNYLIKNLKAFLNCEGSSSMTKK